MNDGTNVLPVQEPEEVCDDFLSYIEDHITHSELCPHHVEALGAKCDYWWAVAVARERKRAQAQGLN